MSICDTIQLEIDRMKPVNKFAALVIFVIGFLSGCGRATLDGPTQIKLKLLENEHPVEVVTIKDNVKGYTYEIHRPIEEVVQELESDPILIGWKRVGKVANGRFWFVKGSE